MPRVAAIIIIILVVIGVSYYWSTNQKPQQEPTTLTFSLDFPKSIVAGQSTSATITVTNSGADATGVAPVLLSDAITASSSPVDIKRGATSAISLTITGKDIIDGSYAVVIFLQYSSQLGTNKTDSKGISIYLLPHVKLTSIRFEADLSHLFSQDSIGKNDNRNLLFQVQSMSSSTIYSGMTVSIKLNLNVPGLSITPVSLPIGLVGPNGRTGDYSFKIISNGAPPGIYNLQISLYSKDNQLVTQEMKQLTVTG